LCFPTSMKIIFNCLMSNFLIILFYSFGLIDYVLRILWSCQLKKKHITYNAMLGHFCTDIKVSYLHNLMKEIWLIPKIPLFFLMIGYAHEWLFQSTLLVSTLLKKQIIFSFWICSSYFLWNCLGNYFVLSSFREDYY